MKLRITVLAFGCTCMCYQLLAQTGGTLFTLQNQMRMGGTQNDQTEYAARAEDGSIYVLGQFRSTATFSPGGAPLSPLGTPDLFLAKYYSDMSIAWVLRLGRISLINGMNAGGLGSDNQGNVTICGSFSSNVNFNPLHGNDVRTSAGGSDAFVARYNPQGELLWVKTWGSPQGEIATALAVGPEGDTYVGITYFGTIAPNPDDAGQTLNPGVHSDAVLVKLSPNGEYQWHLSPGGAGNDEITALALSEDGAHVAYGALTSGTGGPFSESELLFGLANTGGTDLWQHALGNASQGNRVRKVAFDGPQHVLFGGEIQAVTDFDPTDGETVVSPLFKDVFAARYQISNNSLQLQWAVSPRSTGIQCNLAWMHCMAGYLYMVGSFDESIFFEANNFSSLRSSAGQRDLFGTVYNVQTGAWLQAEIYGGLGDEHAADGVGENAITLVGSFSGSWGPAADQTLLESVGGRDGFLAMYQVGTSVSVPRYGAYDGPDLTLFPVPAREKLYLRKGGKHTPAGTVRIINIVGKVEATYHFATVAPYHSIPILPLPAGIYILEFESGGVRTSRRFVKD